MNDVSATELLWHEQTKVSLSHQKPLVNEMLTIFRVVWLFAPIKLRIVWLQGLTEEKKLFLLHDGAGH